LKLIYTPKGIGLKIALFVGQKRFGGMVIISEKRIAKIL